MQAQKIIATAIGFCPERSSSGMARTLQSGSDGQVNDGQNGFSFAGFIMSVISFVFLHAFAINAHTRWMEYCVHERCFRCCMLEDCISSQCIVTIASHDAESEALRHSQ